MLGAIIGGLLGGGNKSEKNKGGGDEKDRRIAQLEQQVAQLAGYQKGQAAAGARGPQGFGPGFGLAAGPQLASAVPALNAGLTAFQSPVVATPVTPVAATPIAPVAITRTFLA